MFESLVNSDRYQTLNKKHGWNLRLRALLIQIGIKPLEDVTTYTQGLRALLIQIGIKPSRLFGATDPCLRVLLILYVGNNLQM